MKIPKKAIERAIEGGWKCPAYYELGAGNNTACGEYSVPMAVIALDPTFWQALGKALGWGEKACLECGFSGRFDDYHGDCGKCTGREYKGWERQALVFSHLILTGGDTEPFWATLLTQ